MVDPRVLVIVAVIALAVWVGEKTVEGVKWVGHKTKCTVIHVVGKSCAPKTP